MGAVSGGAFFTPLSRIETDGGEVIQAMRSDGDGFVAIEEAYFSRVNAGGVRAWKFHTKMTVNAVVPVGHLRFVVATADGGFDEYDLGPDHDHGRLTIRPETWFGFQAGPAGGLLLNLADILHDPDEPRARALDAFDYTWA